MTLNGVPDEVVEDEPSRPGADLKKDSLWRLAQVIGGSGFAALYLLLYAQVIEKKEFGVYGMLVVGMGVLQTVAGAGLRQAITRFVAHTRGQGALGRLRQFAVQGFRLTVMTTLATLLLSWGIYELWSTDFADVPRSLALLVVLSVLARVPRFLLQGILEGLGQFRSVAVSLLGMNVAQLVLILGGALVGLNVFRILLLEAVVAWLGALIFGAQVRRKMLTLPKLRYNPLVTREALLFGVPLVINAIAGFLYSRVDVFFIRKYLEASDVADYFLMLTLFQFPLRALNSYIFVLSVDVSRAHGAAQYKSILQMFYKAEGFGLLSGLGLAAVFVLASFVVPLILPEYQGAALLMRLVAPVLVVKCVAQVASGAFLVSLGRPRAMAGLSLVGGLVNVVLDIVLIPRFGSPGAVYATLIGHTVIGVAGIAFILTGVRRLVREQAAP